MGVLDSEFFPKWFNGRLTQAGVAAPVLTQLVNRLGCGRLVGAYSAQGTYTLTAPERVFTSGTLALIGPDPIQNGPAPAIEVTSSTVLTIFAVDWTGALADSILSSSPILILVLT